MGELVCACLWAGLEWVCWLEHAWWVVSSHMIAYAVQDGSIKEVLINSNVYKRGLKFVHTRCFTRDVTDFNKALREKIQAEAAAEVC